MPHRLSRSSWIREKVAQQLFAGSRKIYRSRIWIIPTSDDSWLNRGEIRPPGMGARNEAARKFGMRNDLEQERRWADAWEVADQYLSRERARDLRSMSDKQARELIARIFSGPTPALIERRTGLIERQRLFRLLK